jgi:hypothetical protein
MHKPGKTYAEAKSRRSVASFEKAVLGVLDLDARGPYTL